MKDNNYWWSETGQRVWQNKENREVRVIRPQEDSTEVIYTKSNVKVGTGSIADFMKKIDEYHPLGRPSVELNTQESDTFAIHLEYPEKTFVEKDVVDYDISDHELLMEINHKDGAIIYYNLKNIVRFEITKNGDKS